MATYFSDDITFLELINNVLRELKEPENVGSEAVTLDLVRDTINTIYSESFNDRRMKPSARENDISFTVTNTESLTLIANPGDVTLTVGDTSTYLTAGKLLINTEVVDYTGKTATTFTGVTGLTTTQQSGTIVRQLYPLATIAPNLDDEQIASLLINGIPQEYMSYENLIPSVNFRPNSYTVYRQCLLLSQQSYVGTGGVQSTALLTYMQKVTRLAADTDKPSLIPNSYRVPILVFGTCWRIAAADAFKTSFDYWKTSYETALSQFIAQKNNRVRDINNKRRPSIYAKNHIFSRR